MKSLKTHDWKGVYRTGEDDLLQDFYLKALSCATNYDRGVGYFSSELLTFASQGLSELIRSGGKMRLIIGHPLDEEEYTAVKNGAAASWAYDQLESKILDTLSGQQGEVAKYRLQLLSWMLACGALEIKFAFRKKGMYHEKIGILRDQEGNGLVFHGSANETFKAMNVESNSESISVYPSWNEEVFESYGKHFIEGFESTWNGRQRDTYTLEVPSHVYESIAKKIDQSECPNLDIENQLAEHATMLERLQERQFDTCPFVPSVIGGREFSVRDHQRSALTKWRANDYRGILKLATGSGKTITAIYGTVKIYEAFSKLAVVIAVPYLELASQWVENLAEFGIYPHKCFDSRKKWFDRLKLDIQAFNSGGKDFLCMVTVNKTLTSDHFMQLIGSLPGKDILFIGDECHRHGAKKSFESLPDAALRLGLSATPFRSDEDEIDSPFPDEARERLLSYYGPVIAEYTLSDAINDEVLTPYYYHIHPVRLTEFEQESYEKLTAKIGQLISLGERPTNDGGVSGSLTALCGERSRLLGSAENKFFVLTGLLSELHVDSKGHALFYCAEGTSDADGKEKRNTDRVSEILKQSGWRASHFTSEETSSERRSLLDSFLQGGIDALVAMKVLDEGIDIPICRTAFILASTKNPRQYVQRRGRILRRYPGKKHAVIHDFIVLPTLGWEGSSPSIGLVKSEMERVYDFMELANNKREVYEELDAMGLDI